MSSVNFDRAAGFYDQTRLLPAGLAEQGLPVLLEWAGPAGRMLEVGIGTGRVAGPLWERGARLAGCDISAGMLGRLRAKHPRAPVALGEAGRLPFAAGLFRVVLTIHVLHLVDGWHSALEEIRRVLAPGGVHVVSWFIPDEQAPAYRLREFWRGQVAARGAVWRRPGMQSAEELLAAVQALGGRLERRLDLPAERPPYTPRAILTDIAGRVYSDAWDVPEAVHAEGVRATEAFALAEYGDLDQPYTEAASRSWMDFFAYA